MPSEVLNNEEIARQINQEKCRLAECPDASNCVSTLAGDPRHAIAPIAYAGNLEHAKALFLEVLTSFSRATLVEAGDYTLHVEYRSRLFRFVDDVEVVFDDREKAIHFRCGARLGRYDFGVNRRRMERIRDRFERIAQDAYEPQTSPA